MKKVFVSAAILALTACDKINFASSAPPPSDLLSVEQTSAIIKPMMKAGESADLWASDIHHALSTLKKQSTADNVCAIVAVIEQESGFKADPAVAGIRQILAKKIAKMESNPLLSVALNLRMAQAAANGKTFRENIIC